MFYFEHFFLMNYILFIEVFRDLTVICQRKKIWNFRYYILRVHTCMGKIARRTRRLKYGYKNRYSK